ncbi:hypothetical protein O3P69_002912 [Scylla paramamosain]|uniref:Uncharacterized protein n=1 Tax=Scylla paramamosain TaxID=85552 RepID=A0AAW0UIG3_SCYPA
MRSNKHTSLESFRNQQSGPDVKVSAASGGCPLCLVVPHCRADVKVSAASVWCPLCLPGGAAWCVLPASV